MDLKKAHTYHKHRHTLSIIEEAGGGRGEQGKKGSGKATQKTYTHTSIKLKGMPIFASFGIDAMK